jgi:hypothetical protein
LKLPRVAAALCALAVGACGGPPGEQSATTDPESLTGTCSFSTTANTYDGPNYWGTIAIKNGGGSAWSGFAVSFDVPAGAHCTNDVVPAGAKLSPLTGSGASAHTQSNKCTFAWTGTTLAAGASKTFNYSTDSASSHAATNVAVTSASCHGSSSGSGGSGGSGSGGSSGSSSGGGCGPDPTAGFTEYTDRYDVQDPYNVPVSQRFSFANGIYTTWVFPTDLPFKQGSPTAPRTEMRWLQNWNTGERMMEADVLVDSPTDTSCITQVKSDDANVHEALYLRVVNGDLRNVQHSGPEVPIAANVVGRWFHLNVAYDATTLVGRVWLDRCLIYTRTQPVAGTFYFKNGNYGCTSSICRSHFQNIRFWER